MTATTFREQYGWSHGAVRSHEPSGCDEHPDRPSERVVCADSFRHFLAHWWFRPEEGRPRTMARLWPGQEDYVAAAEEHNGLLLLKAGKLGFTELACAFDGWRLLYGPPNCRVHLFSRNLDAAKEVLDKVAFGIERIPGWLGLPVEHKTTTEITLRAGEDDRRRARSYPATPDTAIDLGAHHSHVDEIARMPWPRETWSAVQSTVVPGGTVHVLSRGRGDDNYLSDLWEDATAGGTMLHPVFIPWDRRPRTPSRALKEGEDPSGAWYAEQQASLTTEQLNWLAPRTAEDALSGEPEDPFLPRHLWDACLDPDLPPLDVNTPIVIGVDAGVTDDLFAAVAVSRHPLRYEDPAIRAVKVWRPDGPDGKVDFSQAENWLRWVCLGGCVSGHPNPNRGALSAPPPGQACEDCEEGRRVGAHNVVCVTYDLHQLHQMMQRLEQDQVVWCEQFDQNQRRLVADTDLRKFVIGRRLSHNGDATLADHVSNARAQISKTEDTKLRAVKRSPSTKIDALVAASMAVNQCLTLVMSAAQR